MDMIVPALLVLLVGLVGWLLVRKPAATSDAGSAGRAEALQAQLDALLQEKRGLIDEKQALAQDKTRLEVQVQVAQEARAEAVAKAEEATGKAQAFERAGLQTQGEIQRLNTELSLITKQVAEKGAEAQKLLEAGQALRQEHNQLQQAHALLQGQHQSLLQEKADRTIALKNEIEQLQEQFKNSVNELMDVKSRALKEDNKDSVNQLMEPLRQKMTEFSTRVEDLNKQSAEQHGSLKQELGNIQQLNQALTQEAHNLAQALRGDAKVMGDWGEHTLELVLESSGLQKGIHYTTQEVLRGDEGVVRTDITLHLPQGRNVVIDI
jgi:DNA recombination protein RmuC